MGEQSRVVAIEGNTGCGKTEVLRWLSTFPDVKTCEVNDLNFFKVVSICFCGLQNNLYIQRICYTFFWNYSMIVLQEPIEKWRHFSGQNLLNLRYNNPKRWSFAFQNLVQLSRLKMYDDEDNNNPKAIRFIERSLHSNRWVILVQMQTLSESENCLSEVQEFCQ